MSANAMIFIIYTLIVWFAAPTMLPMGVAFCGLVLSMPAWFVLGLVKGGKI